MPSKKHKSEKLVGNLPEVEPVVVYGMKTAEAYRQIAITEQLLSLEQRQ